MPAVNPGVGPLEGRGRVEEGPEGLLPLRESSGGAESNVVDDAGLPEDSLTACDGWAELEERLLRVRCPSGAGLMAGPGDRFPVLETLPVGVVVVELPRPRWARVAGWVYVEAELFHGQAVRGWVEDSLLEEYEI